MTYSVSQAADKAQNISADTSSEVTAHPPAAELSSVQTRLSCLLEGLSPEQRDQERNQALEQLGIQTPEAIPIFDEATQTIARLLKMPICLLSTVDANTQRFKSAVGLSSLGLMNGLAITRSLPRQESFCTHVIDSNKAFVLANATTHPAFSNSLLVQQYGIHAYAGVPLMTTEGVCIGTLAAMDLRPHLFTQQEVSLLELSARWCMSEFEKQQMHAKIKAGQPPYSAQGIQTSANPLLDRIEKIRFDLVLQLAQDLRNPLTSITGMANMLNREIYGPLSEKQQEYTKIVLNSSQQLLSMVDEISEIGSVQADDYKLSLATVDIEMLVHQAISALEGLAKQQDLVIKSTVEPSSRIWVLDKSVVKQLIYHLVFSVIKMSTAGSTIRLHISRKDNSVSIALWVSNPWLGEDLPQAMISWDRDNTSLTSHISSADSFAAHNAADSEDSSEELLAVLATAQKVDTSRQELGLLLSRHLTEVHGGEAGVQGSASTGYRYVITLPERSFPE
ncbi:MAG: GAF domain-containing sensor histidine kinase [Cyanobacteria bacterium P01_D01_bin.105]